MIGYKSSRAVKYRCEMVTTKRTVTQGNTASIEIENDSELALGEVNKFSGAKLRISGMGESRVGANKEKAQDGLERKQDWTELPGPDD